MLTIGLTGGIASGKSTVADFFRELGVPIIDTDVIARELVNPGQSALDEIVETFGSDILTAEKNLDRGKLREIVFHDTHKRKLLEAILHPRIRKHVFNALESLNSTYAIVVIPLLFETDYPYPLDRVLTVNTSPDIQRQRLLAREGMNETTAQAILKAQLPAAEKTRLADDVLTNEGDLAMLRQHVEKLHHQYLILADASAS